MSHYMQNCHPLESLLLSVTFQASVAEPIAVVADGLISSLHANLGLLKVLSFLPSSFCYLITICKSALFTPM